MFSRQLVVIAFALSAVCSWPVEAFACDCVGGPTRDLLRLADLVYTGRVTAIRVGPRYAWPEIEFSVDHTFKGKVIDRRVVLHTRPTRGVDCEGFNFEGGRPYLVFAAARHSVTARPDTHGVSWCAGTVELDTPQGRERLGEVRAMAGRR